MEPFSLVFFPFTPPNLPIHLYKICHSLTVSIEERSELFLRKHKRLHLLTSVARPAAHHAPGCPWRQYNSALSLSAPTGVILGSEIQFSWCQHARIRHRTHNQGIVFMLTLSKGSCYHPSVILLLSWIVCEWESLLKANGIIVSEKLTNPITQTLKNSRHFLFVYGWGRDSLTVW